MASVIMQMNGSSAAGATGSGGANRQAMSSVDAVLGKPKLKESIILPVLLKLIFMIQLLG